MSTSAGVVDAAAGPMALFSESSDQAIPTDLPAITSAPIVVKGFVQAGCYDYDNVVVPSSNTIQSGRPTFTIQMPANYWALPRSFKMVFQFDRTTLLDLTNNNGPVTTATNGPVAIINGDWDTMVMDAGGYWNMFSNVVATVNKISVQSYQAPYMAQNACLATQLLPQNYLDKCAPLEHTIRGNYMNQNGQNNSTKLAWGNPHEHTDFTFWGQADQTIAGGTETVYIKADMYQFWWMFQDQNQFFTSQSTIDLTFQLAVNPATLNVTLVKTDVLTAAISILPNGPGALSMPVSLTLRNMWIEYDQTQIGQDTLDGMMQLNTYRPLSLQFNWPQWTIDSAVNNLPLSNTSNVPGANNGWGLYVEREYLRAQMNQPRFIVPMVFATCKWGPGPIANTQQNGAWNSNVFTWSRTVQVPSMLYIRQWFLSGQQYGRDVWLDQVGTGVLNNINGWVQMMQRKWDKSLQFRQSKYVCDIEALKGKQRRFTSDPTQLATGDGVGMQYVHIAKCLWDMMTRGPIIETLNNNYDINTLTISRMDQIEAQFYLMPAPNQLALVSPFFSGAPNYLQVAAIPMYLAPFMFADCVASTSFINGNSLATGLGTEQQVWSIPTSVNLTIYWAWVYPSEMTFGAERTVQYSQLQQAMPTTSIVPGTMGLLS